METQPRLDVLYASLTIEHMITLVLGDLLDIDTKTSKTLGSKTSSLSFMNKVNLIRDIRAIEKDDLPKFDCFASIRNQFMHNLKVDTFATCFNNLDGKDKYLKKIYYLVEQKDLSEEQVLKKCFESLFMDLNKIIGKLLNKVRDKYYELGKSDGRKRYAELLIESMHEIGTELPDKKEIIDEIIKRADNRYEVDSKKMTAQRSNY